MKASMRGCICVRYISLYVRVRSCVCLCVCVCVVGYLYVCVYDMCAEIYNCEMKCLSARPRFAGNG